MSCVYRSLINETTRKTLLESPHPHLPYQAHVATEEKAAHTTAAEEAAQAYTPVETKSDTPGDTYTPPDTNTLADIQANTPAPDNVAHADTVSGPSSGMDLSVTSIPPQHQP